MSIRNKSFFAQGRLFKPKMIRQLVGASGFINDKTQADLSGSAINSTSSFRYDPVGTGIKSTQQLPVDFSKFENHTFFDSAESKTNVAFDKMVNGSKKDFIKAQEIAFKLINKSKK